jgi:MarR family transcriptional regulator, temperature-dependent positive regulator of motility
MPRRTDSPSTLSISARQQHELAAAKAASTLQLLFRAARLLDARAVARVAAAPAAAGLRTAHTALFPHIDFAGVRLTELARRVGVTKQATAQLVDELEAWEMVERVPDPGDGRAKLIRFSKRGHAALLHGLAVLRNLEKELAGAIGRRRMAELRRALVAVLAAIDTGAASGAVVSRPSSAARPRR